MLGWTTLDVRDCVEEITNIEVTDSESSLPYSVGIITTLYLTNTFLPKLSSTYFGLLLANIIFMHRSFKFFLSLLPKSSS